ncbi:MAG: ABC transporter permease, partial [Anaerococcus prevotii]|nr:ABC transporter permease [Anaerococcus prevotii]
EVEKLRSIEDIKLIGKMSNDPDNAKYNNDLLVINYQDEAINKMREYSRLQKGRFAENKNEIVLSESFINENSINLGDEIKLEIGKRFIDGEEIGPTSANTDKKKFKKVSTKSFTVVGVYGDVYNKYSKLNFALGLQEKMSSFKTYVKFDSFEKTYKNKENIQEDINNKLGRDVELEFSDGLIYYYGIENDPLQKIMSKAVIVLSILGCIAVFVFFIKNIFWVWGLRKIRELSIYKSIGSTNGQIYLMLLKEGLIISAIPILLGHIAGYSFIYYLYSNIQKGDGVSAFEVVRFNPLLSLAILFVSFIIVALAIKSPAKKISKINIIDGIRGNIDFSKYQKKKKQNLWQELRINNLASIKSQRYISAIGILIISVFVIVIGIGNYLRDYSYYDNGYNFSVDYYSDKDEVPSVLKEIDEKTPNEKSYISKQKYVIVENNKDFSKEARNAGLDKEAEKNIEKYNAEGMDGFLIALEDDDLKELGGNKGEFLLYNMIQEDSSIPISKAKKIPYFENPTSLDISIGDDYQKNIKISKSIRDLGKFNSKTMPFDVKIYTDFDTFFSLMKEAGDEKYKNYPYTLNMKIKDSKAEDAQDYAEALIRERILPEDRFNIIIGNEIEEKEFKSLQSFMKIVVSIGLIIVVLNITNGYSSINLSLMSRRKEIGSFYSCGMDLDELKRVYEKEYLNEQIKSLLIVILTSIGVMFIISIFSSRLTFLNLLRYYDYKLFIAFSLVVYGINVLIYHLSLKRILDRPTIDLIRTI